MTRKGRGKISDSEGCGERSGDDNCDGDWSVVAREVVTFTAVLAGCAVVKVWIVMMMRMVQVALTVLYLVLLLLLMVLIVMMVTIMTMARRVLCMIMIIMIVTDND